MSFERTPQQPPSLVPPGTQVGNWRVVEPRGHGAYGVVYRAVRVGQEDAGPVALKLAMYPWDHRFTREVELLSRLRHPGVPRLLDRGVLRLASGAEHPWFVMDWVEGLPLYAWAEQHAPSNRQVCQVLAQVARALEAVHAAHAAHRDVKGDNVLVRSGDGRAVLIDFGSGHVQGAKRLTWQSLPPSTPAYHSAEACVFYLRSVRDRDAYYSPAPADDVFALGVTAYRLVMGKYPPPMEPHQDDGGNWRVTSADPRPFLEQNTRVEPRLRELILRMLSASPPERGTASELAEALEAAANAPEAIALPRPPHVPEAAGTVEPRPPEFSAGRAGRPRPHAHERARSAWWALIAVGVAGVLVWTTWTRPEHLSASGPQAPDSQAPDAGTAATGDSSPTAPPAAPQAPFKQKPLTQAPPFQPRPEQPRPDGKGRCPGPKQVVINGSCWLELPTTEAEGCVGNGYDFREGKCYVPAPTIRRPPQPTSNPADAR
ncbi:MAG TPA: serine/threonine-protein kinase [Myxococcaceae bacterium]